MRNKRKKSFNWYGLRQRFSIRKYHFGAASVLIGTALVFAGGQTAQANEQASSEPSSALVKDKTEGNGTVGKTESNQNTITEKAVPTEKETATTAAATPAVESTSVKPEATTKENSTPVVEKPELVVPEIAREVVEKPAETPKEKAEEKIEEKAKEDTKKDSKEDSEKKEAAKEVEKAKEDLEKAVNEAKALNASALFYAEKSVQDEKAKDALIQAIENAKKAIEKANELEKSKTVTAEELNKQRSAVNNALEAVYTAMKAAGHDGKVSAVLAGETGSTVNISNPINKVVVNNVGDITEEEARAIEKEIRTANPTLTAEDKIEVKRNGNTGAAVATVTLANGKVDQNGNRTYGFAIGDVAYGSAGEKNFSQLREAINWFDFATASITYADGTKVGAVEYVNNPAMVDFTSSKGRQERGRFTMVRTVLESTTHPELVGKKTNDPAFLASELAKYTLWKTYDDVKNEVQNNQSSGRFNNEIFEVLQEGMRFDVPTKVR